MLLPALVSRIERISKSTERLPDPSQLQKILAMSGLSLQPEVKEQANLPCVMFPPFRISRFFDRSEVVLQIDHFLEKQKKEDSFQSLALWGLGGVGKSSVALRYAETKFHDGELDAMFWIRSEKDVNIRQSFTDIAMRLKLPDANPADHDENKILVLNWLQHTSELFVVYFSFCLLMIAIRVPMASCLRQCRGLGFAPVTLAFGNSRKSPHYHAEKRVCVSPSFWRS